MSELPITAPEREREGHRLRGTLGVFGVVLLVVAAAAPLTAIGGALPVMLAIGNGVATPMTYVVTAVVLLLFSVGYSAMSRYVVDAGAFYAYVTAGLGRRIGTGGAGLALLGYTAIQIAIYALAATTLGDLVVGWGGPALPWWVWATVLVAVVALLGYRSIDLGAKVLGVLLVLEVAVVLVLSIAILAKIGWSGIEFDSFAPQNFFDGSPGIAIMFAVASFVGFEATAIYGEEARNPKRTVPIATYSAIVLIAVFYAFASWTIVLANGNVAVVDAAQENTSGLVFDTAGRFLGAAASETVSVLLLTSLFAALLAFHNAIARYLYSLGRKGILPARLGRTHGRHGSPYFGSAVQTVSALVVLAAFALGGADPIRQIFSWMSGVSTVCILVLMILVSASVIVFFRKCAEDDRRWHTRIAPVLGAMGLLGILALVLSNFTTLIGGSSFIAVVLLGSIVVVFVGGVSIDRSRSDHGKS
ncbi:APC family permease [Rhodococcus sp. I2R]|uniref:APC family permease n=1 Tax=Rhodococcus sp. I2R TaxID=2855445 RepID=UPI001E40CC85|nr:APC family permease [Rhodococcus sp. I2R]MCC8927011.1 APC family permease [Rhodococcus sp. I2R]